MAVVFFLKRCVTNIFWTHITIAIDARFWTLGEPPFEMCVFHMCIARRGGGVKACQDGLEHFFPTFARGCKGLPGWFAILEPTFQKGVFLTIVDNVFDVMVFINFGWLPWFFKIFSWLLVGFYVFSRYFHGFSFFAVYHRQRCSFWLSHQDRWFRGSLIIVWDYFWWLTTISPAM